MRAVLFLVVMIAWMGCMVGALGFTAYLVVLATVDVRARFAGGRRPPSPRPPWLVVAAILGFSAVMAVWGVVLTGPLALYQWWGATAAVVTAVVLGRRPPATAA